MPYSHGGLSTVAAKPNESTPYGTRSRMLLLLLLLQLLLLLLLLLLLQLLLLLLLLLGFMHACCGWGPYGRQLTACSFCYCCTCCCFRCNALLLLQQQLVPRLLQLTQDSSSSVRFAAALLLEAAPEAVPPLLTPLMQQQQQQQQQKQQQQQLQQILARCVWDGLVGLLGTAQQQRLLQLSRFKRRQQLCSKQTAPTVAAAGCEPLIPHRSKGAPKRGPPRIGGRKAALATPGTLDQQQHQQQQLQQEVLPPGVLAAAAAAAGSLEVSQRLATEIWTQILRLPLHQQVSTSVCC